MNRSTFQWKCPMVCGLVFVAAIAYWSYSQRDHSDEESIRRRISAAADEALSSGHTTFLLPRSARKSDVDRQLEKLDPSEDGWDSEVVSIAIDKQLDRLRASVASDSSEGMSDIAADQFDGVILSEDSLRKSFEDGVCQVRRLPVDAVGLTRTDSLKAQMDSLLGADRTSRVVRCSFKIIHIDLAPHEAVTRVLIELVQKTDATIKQSNAVCRCRWVLKRDETPRLRALDILDFEQVLLSAGHRPLMEDVTLAVLGKTDSFNNQVLRGVGHWSERLTGIDDMHIYGHHGVAVGDVNNDGLDDIYVCDSGGLPNRLYLQQPDGTARDASRRSKADWLESTTCANLIDLDNDGDQDLVAATIAGIIIASNNGAGTFKIRTVHTGMPEAHTLCAADYDNDGDLDLFVPNYGPGRSAGGPRGFEVSAPIPYNDANNGGRNVLLENQGGFRFVDVTERCGLEMNNRRWSFAASWEDFDVDGDMDLYVANDFGRNNLYQNDGGKFRDVAAELGVEDMAGGMSVSWADFNRDGLMDIYVGNMFSAAGNRITYQRRFLVGRSPEMSAGVQRMARGNTLFMASSAGTFADVSEMAGVTMGRWAWSSKFADLNNDGWQDLVIANGFVTNENPNDL